MGYGWRADVMTLKRLSLILAGVDEASHIEVRTPMCAEVVAESGGQSKWYPGAI